MKIGILTFHSQLNYGGVLQCWALKTALEQMGHEVVVVDRWVTPDNRMLDGPFGHTSVKGWCVIALKSLLGCGTWKQVLRHWRTRRFVKSLGLTPYHFYEWKDSPKSLGVDCIVVGSDQVWHGGDWGWPTPEPYLLLGAEGRIPRAIAYAASFGMKSLLREYNYAAGFRNFAAISVREKEGVDLVKGAGYLDEVVHVVDPTLLVEPKEWNRLRQSNNRVCKRPNIRTLTCYFLSQDVKGVLPILESWANRSDCHVRVLCDGYTEEFPKSVCALVSRICKMIRNLVSPSRVRICTDYGPKEFVRAFAEADATITDSFHAVMFSSIFNCNARFLRPANEMRRVMFSRIEEFAEKCIEGHFFADDVKQALSFFERGEVITYDIKQIAAMRMASMTWLENALKV